VTRLSVAPLTHFAGPDHTTAPVPPEERGVARDEVRMLVVTDEGVAHARFRDLPAYLAPGDLVVVNNSATLAAEFDALLRGRGPVVVHAATRQDDGTWVVELRTAPTASRAILDARVGDVLELPAKGRLTLLEPYPHADSSPTGTGNRLWRVAVTGPRPLERHLVRYGRPIAYGYLDRAYPLAAYQTVFATRPGSAEMPSAARPFSQELVTRLVATGIGVATVTLHTGVSSQEAGEAPQAEWFEVSATVARLVSATRGEGGRVVAVGTTVTRALESAVGEDGQVTAGSGWTTRVVSRDDPPRVVNGLVTGWHDPEASHLLLVEAVAGLGLTQRAYDEAARGGYLWHEFGDSALLLPGSP
jgi:S-adenosylmethionine:tRNA ribosyltransferase-isomerase